MAGLGTSFISARLIKSTKLLVILFLGLIIFFTNLYFLKIFPTTKEAPKDVRTIRPSASHLMTPSTFIQRKNVTAPTTPPKKGVAGSLAFTSRTPVKMDRSCAHRIREMDGGIVFFRHFTIRSKLGRARVLETYLEHPEEEDEFFTLEKGFFTLYCDGDKNKAKELLRVAKEYDALAPWIMSLEVAKPSLPIILRVSRTFQTGQYLAIQRMEYANVYWTIIDLLDIYITTQRMEIEPEKLSIILMDAHPASSLDPFWSVLFQKLIKLTDQIFTESNDVVFENLVWRYPRDNCPLLDINLQSLKYIQPFRSFVLKRFGISSGVRLRNCTRHKLNVLVIFRRDYKNHPRNLEGIIDRKIANEKDVVSEMESEFSSKVNIITVQLDSLPLKRQLELVASSDIFFGMHGAAHAFPIFMSPGGAVVEMFNLDSDNWHMKKIATLSGHYYVNWTNRNSKAYNRETKSTTIPAGVPSMLLTKAYKKICVPT
ncbi:hypothetical protein ACROYT_G037297 [Oculina patagonica]